MEKNPVYRKEGKSHSFPASPPLYRQRNGEVREIWKDIPEYEGLYKASNMGRILSLERIINYKDGRKYSIPRKILSLGKNTNGYAQIKLCKNNVITMHRVHRLVLSAFRGKKPEMDCNHKNGIKDDNRLVNLEYLTGRENSLHAFRKKKKLSGAYPDKKRWLAKIQINNVPIIIGRFKTEKEAHYAYKLYCKNNNLPIKYVNKI